MSLFIERARSTQPGFSITNENAQAIVEVCRRLDGIPLAIELAAAHIAFMTPQQIRDRLGDSFSLLANGRRNAPARQQPLAAAIEWSCGLLTDAERLLFVRLSIFAGTLPLEAAEAVCAGDGIDPREIVDLIGRLVSKSLVIAEAQAYGPNAYRLLETLRAYGRRHLQASSEAESMGDRHASFYLNLARRSLYEASPASWADKLTRQYDDLEVASRWLIEHGQAEDAQLIGAAMSNVWRQRELVTEGRVTMSELLALPGGAQPSCSRAALLLSAGFLASYQGDVAVATGLLEECLTVLDAVGDARELPMALAYLGDLDVIRGDLAAARARLQRGVEAAQRMADDWAEATLLVRLGQVTQEEGDPDAAAAMIERALPTLRSEGAKRMIAMGLQILATGAAHRGHHAEAGRLLDESLATWQSVHGWQGMAATLLELGRLAADEGNSELAATRFAEGLQLSRDVGNRLGVCSGIDGLAVLAARLGHSERAVTLISAATQLRDATGLKLSARQTDRVRDALVDARRRLSTPRYTAAWEAGATMPANEAIRVALAGNHTAISGQLTQREREVATLVARGFTNAQIARALVIDRRTAEGHVSNILSKLGLTSRTQIATWAIEHHVLTLQSGSPASSEHTVT